MVLVAGTAAALTRFWSAPTSHQPLESLDQIKELTHINGLSLEAIDRRAQPQTRESFRGYLPRGLTLKESLINSWTELTKFRIKHTEIADILDELCADKKDKPNNFFAGIELDFTKHASSLCDLAVQKQNFSIVVRHHTVDKPIQDTDIFRGYWESPSRKTTCEVTLTNPSTNTSIIWTPLRSEFIRKYGFYALGIEFQDVLTLLTGKTKEILDAELKKMAIRILGQEVYSK